MFVSYAQFLNKDVLDQEARFIGRVWDIAVKFGEIYPKASELIVVRGFLKREFTTVSWELVDRIDESIFVKPKISDLKFERTAQNYDFLLRRDVMDQQVVDTYNQKVIRVNDIHLLKVDNDLHLAHVDIGLRGLIRRLGFETAVDFCVKLIRPNAKYLMRQSFISWKYIQPVSISPVSKTMKVSVPQKQLSDIPPADLSQIMMDLDGNQRLAFFRTLDLKTKADIFENLDFEDQKFLLKELDKKEAAQVLSEMSSDEATDLLEHLPQDMVRNLLTLMESGRARKLSTLLGYSGDSAGGIMTTDFVSLPETATVEEAIEFVRTKTADLDYVYYIYIVNDKNTLKGTTTIRKLLRSGDPKQPIIETAYPKTIYVYLHDGTKQVAYLFDKYKSSALPVVDEKKVIQGVITIDDVLSRVILLAWRRRPKKVSHDIA